MMKDSATDIFRNRIIGILILGLFAIIVQAQETATVEQYCNSFSSWTTNKSILNLHAMENLRSVSPAIRIGDKLMTLLADKNGLTKTDTYDWDVYVSCLQKDIDKGLQFSYSNISSVPEDYIDQKYPGVQYVSCNISVKGSVVSNHQGLFILKDNKIVKITDYVEVKDEVTGKKKIEIDYLDLARSAFADKDYAKCYNLYKEGGLKSLDKRRKNDEYIGDYDMFPYVESCVALGKWDEAMHGITDNHVITNRKTWVNGVEWQLNANDLKTWNKDKEPLMDYLLKKIYKFYNDDVQGLRLSPIVKHVINLRNLSEAEIIEDAAQYFWSERRNWINLIPIRCAAELGHYEAQKELGMYYLTGHNNDPVARNSTTIPCDTIKAAYWFEVAAKQGDVKAANIAAHLYLTGNGVERDLTKAYSLYLMGYEKSDFDATYGLGLCYYSGYGVNNDHTRAIQILQDVEDWHAEVSYIIGNIYYMDNYNPKALLYYNRALKRNSLDKSVRRSILMSLSECNRYGRCGLPVNVYEADRLLNEAKNIEVSDEQDINKHLISLTKINANYENK